MHQRDGHVRPYDVAIGGQKPLLTREVPEVTLPQRLEIRCVAGTIIRVRDGFVITAQQRADAGPEDVAQRGVYAQPSSVEAEMRNADRRLRKGGLKLLLQ